jgi:hypothetical protein
MAYYNIGEKYEAYELRTFAIASLTTKIQSALAGERAPDFVKHIWKLQHGEVQDVKRMTIEYMAVNRTEVSHAPGFQRFQNKCPDFALALILEQQKTIPEPKSEDASEDNVVDAYEHVNGDAIAHN